MDKNEFAMAQGIKRSRGELPSIKPVMIFKDGRHKSRRELKEETRKEIEKEGET